MVPDEFPEHWALELYQRCRQFSVLPNAGGAYDQDEYLMAMMNQAAGVSALFDLNGVSLVTNNRRLNLHTSLMQRAGAVIDYINQHETTDGE